MDAELSFGEWLRRRRRGLGLTQLELGQRAGYSGETIRKVEADELRPSRHLVESLAAALSLTPTERAAFAPFARGEAQANAPPISTQTVSLPAPVRHNLPTPPTPLLGRDADVATLRALLLGDAARLVTLTGVGGTGKTRLAVAAAAAALDAFPDGVAFVDLAPLRDSTFVAPTIAQALGVRNTRGRPIEEILQGYLHAKALLLLLDNFEHLLAAAPLVADLLAATLRLKVLVTSREVLRLRGEHVYAVEPLLVPPLDKPLPLERLAEYPAVALFAQRAADAASGFRLTPGNAAAVAGICARLDGLPLAIELAAAHVRVLPPPALLTHLDHRLAVLTHGPRDLPTRQQTLQTEIQWSYDLLSEGEKALFRRLAVFAGGFTLEAADGVTGDWRLEIEGSESPISTLDAVESLVAKSLLTHRENATGEPRFGMLETIREYALERLAASAEAEMVRQAHAAYFVTWIESVEPKLYGEGEIDWFARVEVEHDNLRAALAWEEAERDQETALRLAAAMRRFWYVRGYWSEGRRWLESILAWADGGTPRAQAGARLALGNMLGMLHAHAQALPYLEQVLDLYRSLGDTRRVSNVLQHLGKAALALGDLERAEAAAEESVQLARETGIRPLLALSLSQLGLLAWERGDDMRAESLLIEARAVARQAGSHREAAVVLVTLGFLAVLRDDACQASQRLREAAAEARAPADPWTLVGVLEGCAALAARERPERAARLWGAAREFLEALGGEREPMEQAAYASAVAPARAALGDDHLATLMREGAAMTLEEAVAYALEEDG